MSEEDKKAILAQIEALKSQLNGDFINDLEVNGEIHSLEMTLNGVKPEDSDIDCIGCGS